MSGGIGTGIYNGTPGSGTGTAATKTLQHNMLDDLDAFFDPVGGFASVATYTPDGGAARTINVIFDKEFMPEMGMEASRIYCEAKTTDVIAAKPRETIVIKGVTYRIKEPPHHTATGVSELELSID